MPFPLHLYYRVQAGNFPDGNIRHLAAAHTPRLAAFSCSRTEHWIATELISKWRLSSRNKLLFSFLKSKGSRPLDQYLARYMAGTYKMPQDEIDKLRFATTKQTLASRKVTLFRIFDAGMVNGDVDDVTYESLDQQQGAVRFEGRFANNKTVTEIKDMRKRD